MQTVQSNKLTWDNPVEKLAGVGSTTQRGLNNLGIYCIKELLFHFPYRYLDTSHVSSIKNVKIDEIATVVGAVKQINKKSFGPKKSLVEIIITDNTSYISAVFFNQPFMAENIKEGDIIAIAGKVEYRYNKLQINSPLYDLLEKDSPSPSPSLGGRGNINMGRGDYQTMGILPFHPATSGITNKKLRSLIKAALNYLPTEECLPNTVINKLDLVAFNEAITQIHFPENNEFLKEAKKRLIFQEFLELQLAILKKKKQQKNHQSVVLKTKGLIDKARKQLPFELTKDQNNVLSDILTDLATEKQMNRLLLGEVGSGKTIVSFLSALPAIENGYQACIMAPTEILAIQHYKRISQFASQLGLKITLLSSSAPAKEKEKIMTQISAGEIDLVIGTHALIQEKVDFKNLAFIAVDEQHRFGVEQRQLLGQKGLWPHTLVMTATPIPRSLALTVYGDLDVSIIKELPSGKNFADKVQTVVCGPSKREDAYAKIRREIEKGHQAYIICPLVDVSDKIEAKAVEEEIEYLKHKIFPDLKVSSIHGKLKSEEKEQIMADYAADKIDILVSTTLVEVGIDVANATVMLIENADRFGLAQLHQLRGRVGRGQADAVCILFASLKTQDSIKRMKAIRELKDGFLLAEADLQIRGEGQIFGQRQAGLPDLKIASITKNFDILQQAREEAKQLLNNDHELNSCENLKEEVEEKFNKLLHVSS